MDVRTYLGQGLSEPVSPFRFAIVFGAELGTPNADAWNAPPVIQGQTATFDLSGITDNHEVAVALVNVYNATGPVAIAFDWYRDRDNARLFHYEFQIPDPKASGYSSWAWYYAYSYIGYVPWEIAENGAYHVVATVSGVAYSMPFQVAGIPVVAPPVPPPVPPPVIPPPPVPVPPPEEPVTIFDTIINWIKTAISSITSVVTDYMRQAWDGITQTIVAWVNAAVTAIGGLFAPLVDGVNSVIMWVNNIYNVLTQWVQGSLTGIIAAVSSALAPVWSWIDQATGSINSWVSYQVGNLEAWIGAALAGITAGLGAIQTQLSGYFTWLSNSLPHIVGDVLGTWWDTFVNRVLDFGSWVDKLFDAVGAWFSVDVPGHSPRWTAIFDSMWDYLYRIFIRAPATIATWFTWTMVQGFIGTVKPVSDGIMGIFDSFIARISEAAKAAGQVTPENALGITNQLNSVGATVIAGLVGMTVAGNLTVLGSKIGLGHVSAMIYDLTNYKLITGAFVGALAFAAIQTPLRYYYQNTFRPMLPRQGEADAMFARDQLTSGEYRQLLGYYGLPDRWHENYKDLAYRPMSLVALSTLANAGGFNEAFFTQVLVDRGIHPKWRPAMLDMYRRKGQEVVKGSMGSTAVSRYKQGYTDSTGFHAEMDMLAYTDDEIMRYQVGANLQYATDYITDLISGWQAQVRKKVMSLAAFSANLGTVIMVPERVDALVAREIVNAPVEEPKAAGISIAVTRYSTGESTEAQFRAELELLGCPPIDIDRNVAAAGLVYAHDYNLDLITAYRDAVRANNLTLDEYRQALLGLGLVPERVEGMVLIERARIKPKQALTPKSPPAAYYDTDIGKVAVDTIRRQRRKGQTGRDQEIAALIGTGYEPGEAGVIADNDDVRLSEKSPAGA